MIVDFPPQEPEKNISDTNSQSMVGYINQVAFLLRSHVPRQDSTKSTREWSSAVPKNLAHEVEVVAQILKKAWRS